MENKTTSTNNTNIQGGEIRTASEARFQAAHYSEPLTAFTTGWKDPENIEQQLEYICPTVHVGRRFEFKKAINAEAFLSETDDVREIGGSFKRVQYSGETVYEKTHNKGLTIRIDHDEMVGDDWQERYVQLLMQRLYRNELRRTIALLDTVAKDTKVNWDTKSIPDAALRKEIIKGGDASGIRPNRVLFSESAWDKRIEAYESKENIASVRSADLSPADLARKLLVDDVRVLKGRFHNSSKSKEQFGNNSVFAFFGQNSVTKDEPSNLKRFVTPSEGGKFRVYLEEHAKYTDISVEHYSNIVVTSDLGIQKMTVSEK